MITPIPSLNAMPFTIDATTRPGHVHLTVTDLSRQIAFYRDVLGLKLRWREDTTVGLGTDGEDLLRLSLLRGARRVRGTSGLYHFAILLPNRRELARAIARLFSLRYTNYPTDHVITKTTYLDDPEGNGIELYADSPEDGTATVVNGNYIVRHANGDPSDGREPLNVEALLSELTLSDRLDVPMPEETKIGHVHLHVADVDQAMHCYHDLLGFDNQGLVRAYRMGMVSAGGYHHHIAFNTWAGVGVPPLPPDARGLRYFTVMLPSQTALSRMMDRVRQAGIATEQTEEGSLVRDPSGIAVLLSTSK